MSELTAIDIVIPAYGASRFLAHVVAALQQQSPPIGRIFISHSGDGDPSPRFSAMANVTVVHSAERLFAGAARNRGMAMATTPWVAFIDDDMIVGDGWHRALLAAIACGDADAIVGSIGHAVSGGYWGISLWFVEFGSHHPYRVGRYGYGGGSCNMAVCRKTFSETGGFPEDWRMGQDSFAQARLLERGHRVHFDPRVCAGHINLPGIRRTLRHAYHLGRNSAKMRRVYPTLPGGWASRRPILSLGMWLVRLGLVYRGVFDSRDGPVLSLLFHTPGILIVLLAWNVGFSREAFLLPDRRDDY